MESDKYDIEEADSDYLSSSSNSSQEPYTEMFDLEKPVPLEVYMKQFSEVPQDSEVFLRLQRYKVTQAAGRPNIFGVSNSAGTILFAKYDLKNQYEAEKKSHEILDSLNCPSIIKMTDAIPIGQGGIIMTPMYFRCQHSAWRDDLKYVMKQFLQALKVCHENGIAHRDIKSLNIVWDFGQQERYPQEIKIFLTDFGLASNNFTEYKTKTIEPSQMPGTLRYFSPERLRGEVPPDLRVCDVFAAGVVFLELLTDHRRHMFPEGTLDNIYALMNNFDERVGNELLPSAADLLKKMLEIDYRKRITAAEALEHQFFKDMSQRYFYRSSYAISHSLSLKNIDDPSWIIEHKLEDK